MGNIPVPDRGQPLDVEYIYTMAEAINSLATQVSSATSKYTTVDVPESGPKNVRTGDARIVAGYVTINTASSIAANTSVPFQHSLGVGFAYAPVVTATAINRGVSGAQLDVSVVLDSVTSQSVSGQVYFRTAGNFSIDVNILAVGIPSSSS